MTFFMKRMTRHIPKVFSFQFVALFIGVARFQKNRNMKCSRMSPKDIKLAIKTKDVTLT